MIKEKTKAHTDQVAPLPSSSCKSLQTTLLSSQELQFFWQLLLEGSYFLQTEDICGVSLTTPVAEVATYSTSQLVGTFVPRTHQLVDYITKTSTVPIYRTTCRSLSTGQHLTFVTAELNSKWAFNYYICN